MYDQKTRPGGEDALGFYDEFAEQQMDLYRQMSNRGMFSYYPKQETVVNTNKDRRLSGKARRKARRNDGSAH